MSTDWSVVKWYSSGMKYDAQTTRQSILTAAAAEFAQYGIAGARVDRIARAANCSKAMIYAYYTSKDLLFDAVFDALVVCNMHDVPIDARDLPEYAARLLEQHQKRPEALRLATWDRLERGARGMNIRAVVEAREHKVAEIRKAQQEGAVSDHFPADTLLELILALTQTSPTFPEGAATDEELGKHRQAVKDAVNGLSNQRSGV